MPLQAVQTFEKMIPMLEKQGAAIVAKVGCVYLFELREKKGDQPAFVTVDLKNGNGKISFVKEGKPDSTFVMLDADFMKLVAGKLKPQEAFM
jgi:putative sterol carrier protein